MLSIVISQGLLALVTAISLLYCRYGDVYNVSYYLDDNMPRKKIYRIVVGLGFIALLLNFTMYSVVRWLFPEIPTDIPEVMMVFIVMALVSWIFYAFLYRGGW